MTPPGPARPRRRSTRRAPPPPPPPRAAARAAGAPSPGMLLRGWLRHHFYALFSTLGQMARAPVSSLMTAAVIGIALALPTGLYLLLQNALQVSRGWEVSTQISLFLDTEVGDDRAAELAETLRARPDVASVKLLRKAEALEEYRRFSGFAEALAALEENPLPAVLVVKPIRAERSQALLADLENLPAVNVAQYDMRWLKRLYAMMALVERGVWLLAGLLGLAVLLIVGNTIRLAIYNRQQEIEIIRLFGATDAFIRRPFLYSGMWHGLLGSLFAWLLVESAFWSLREPVAHLASLYAGEYSLITLGLADGLKLLAIGPLLGLLGAWLAVSRHLRAG